MAAGDADAAAVERARSGDRAAFGELVTKYRGPVERLVRRYVKDEEEARDVGQSAFLRAFQHIDSFRGDSAFRTWLYRIAINTAINHRQTLPPQSWLEIEDDMVFTRSLGTTRVAAAELWRKVMDRINDLPPKQRLVVELRLFHEMSFAEIGEIAGCSENSAKVNFHHGVGRLRELAPKE